MSLVRRWKVTVTFARPEVPAVVIWIFDNQEANVLRKVAEMQFSEKGLERVQRIVIEDQG